MNKPGTIQMTHKPLLQNEWSDKYDIEINHRAVLLKIIFLIGFFNLVPLGIHAIVNNIPMVGIFDLSVAGILLILFLFLIKTGYHIFFSYVGIFSAGILFVFLLATGGFNNTGHVWYFTFPLFTLFLLGSRKGTIITTFFFAIAILIFSFESHEFITAAYSGHFKIRFLASFVVVSAFAISFEYIREKTQHQLAIRNTALKKTIIELENTETLLQATLESTADGILVVSDTGQVISKNTRFAKMWKIPQNILNTNDDKKFLNWVLSKLKDPLVFLSKVEELYNSDKNDFDSFEFKNGRLFERYSEPLIVNKKIMGRVWSFRDVTERIQSEKEKSRLQNKLQQAQKLEAIGTLAGGVAHDLNNVLSGIVSYPELILLELPKDSPIRNSIQTIKDSGKKAAAIVQDLLTLARRGVPTAEIVNLNDTVSEYMNSPEFMKLKTFHPLVKIESFLHDSLLNILGSPVHLSKTVMNLISNAAEAISAKGTISITTENKYIDQCISGYDDVTEGDYVVLTVADTGVGMETDEVEKIFEPFYTKKVMGRSGTGLGMAVVWGTIKDHDGYIHIDSKISEGTSFKLYFPVTRQTACKNQEIKGLADYRGNGEKILVVDDIKEQQDIASKILSQLGYSVSLAADGEEAVRTLRNNKADLVILDMIMSPGIDGLETFEQIKSINPEQKAIIVSGFSESDRVLKAQRLGAGAYVKKPYTIETIGVAVKTELEKMKHAA